MGQQDGGGGEWRQGGGNSPFKLKHWCLGEEAVRAVFIFGNKNMCILFS